MIKSNDNTGNPMITGKKSGADILSGPSMQKDFSIFSLATAHSSNAYQSEYGDMSTTLAPTIRFGMHKKRDGRSSPNLMMSPSNSITSPFKGRGSRGPSP